MTESPRMDEKESKIKILSFLIFLIPMKTHITNTALIIADNINPELPGSEIAGNGFHFSSNTNKCFMNPPNVWYATLDDEGLCKKTVGIIL